MAGGPPLTSRVLEPAFSRWAVRCSKTGRGLQILRSSQHCRISLPGEGAVLCLSSSLSAAPVWLVPPSHPEPHAPGISEGSWIKTTRSKIFSVLTKRSHIHHLKILHILGKTWNSQSWVTNKQNSSWRAQLFREMNCVLTTPLERCPRVPQCLQTWTGPFVRCQPCSWTSLLFSAIFFLCV